MVMAEGSDEEVLPVFPFLQRPLPRGSSPSGSRAGREAGSQAACPGAVVVDEENEWTEEPNILVLLCLEEFLFMVHNYKQALVDLLLQTNVQVRLAESPEELAEFVSMFTKAVAEAPYKRERENTGFSFCVENEGCRGVKVDRTGKGLLEVWKRQIQQFNRVSLDMAEAIVSAYPSPQLLVQAYSKCSSEEEQENMLANIVVRRGEGVTATTRRIGPELSRRIYLQMTSHDPDLCLDFTE
uniref:Essential meiotic structure-specific endonuclease 1 n=1 Tax=Nothoprocta perdicaria TaxID=30464 RepID=A0A8C7EAR8_NOTPE